MLKKPGIRRYFNSVFVLLLLLCFSGFAVADEEPEATAEYLHKKARDFCGYGLTEDLSTEDLIQEKFVYPRGRGHSALSDLHNQQMKTSDQLTRPGHFQF